MGELAARVDSMRVRASTPDGTVTAELYGRDQLTLTFRERFYDLCTDNDLQRPLTVVANLLWVARTREYRRIWADVTGDDDAGDDTPRTAVDAEWRDARDDLVATGTSDDGRITVTVVGMRQWDIRIRPGTVRALDEHQFGAALSQAAGALIGDQFTKLAALSHRYYGDHA